MLKVRIRSAVATGLMALGVLVSPTSQGTADAVFPGVNGRIAFTLAAPAGESSDIWTVHPDGTGLRRVTWNGVSTSPRWAPSGRLIAHLRHTIRDDVGSVWTIRSDGTGARRITTGVAAFQPPAWSPSGRQLLVVRPVGNGSDLFRVPLSGGTGQRVTFSAGQGCRVDHPSWRWNLVVYARHCPGTEQIRILNLSTRASHPVVSASPAQARITWPDFTADMRVMFMSCGLDPSDLPCPFGVDVTTIDRNGTGLTSLTETCGCQGDVSLGTSAPAPNGVDYAFVSFDPGLDGTGTNSLVVSGHGAVCCGGQFGDPTPSSPDWQRLPG